MSANELRNFVAQLTPDELVYLLYKKDINFAKNLHKYNKIK